MRGRTAAEGRVKGTQRKQALDEDKRIDFAKMSLLCFHSLAGIRCFAVLHLVKHDSLFSLDTKPLIWTFVDRRKKSGFTKDRNRHFEGCGEIGVWWQHEKHSAWKIYFPIVENAWYYIHSCSGDSMLLL